MCKGAGLGRPDSVEESKWTQRDHQTTQKFFSIDGKGAQKDDFSWCAPKTYSILASVTLLNSYLSCGIPTWILSRSVRLSGDHFPSRCLEAYGDLSSLRQWTGHCCSSTTMVPTVEMVPFDARLGWRLVYTFSPTTSTSMFSQTWHL